jgi:hypothetical protein
MSGMTRSPLLLLVAAAAALLAPAAALASPPEVALVRPGGDRGSLVALDPATGGRVFALPAGIASADGTRYAVGRAAAARTQLRVYDPRTAAQVRALSVAGRWQLGGVSTDGRWLALERRAGARTAVEVVGETGRLRARRTLPGRWDVDTLSRDGRYLFLIQHLAAAGGTAYVVWVDDLPTGRLTQPGAVGPDREDGPMAGYAQQAVASPDGRWYLTLYLDVRRRVAFVHALDLRARRPACIDLPAGDGRLEELRGYALALAPDGRTLLAANPALGVVARIDLPRLRVVGARGFAAAPAAGRTQSAIAGDGTLVFAAGRSVWTLRDGRLARSDGAPVRALAVDGGGTVLALRGPRLEQVAP